MTLSPNYRHLNPPPLGYSKIQCRQLYDMIYGKYI